MQGKFAGGERLSEEKLRQELGVSRTPVREALRRLHSEGLVRLVPHKGATVVSFSPSEVREAYFVRALLEGGAARRVAERARECDFSGLERVCEQYSDTMLRTQRRYRSLSRLNKLFHQMVVEMAGCPKLKEIMETLWPVFDKLTLRMLLLPEAGELIREHTELTRVMQTGNADAAERKMRDHVIRAGDLILDRLHGGERDEAW